MFPNTQISSTQQSFQIAQNFIGKETTGVFSSELLRNFKEILEMYRAYEEGADPKIVKLKGRSYAELRFKIARRLINKQARFLFANPPSIEVSRKGVKDISEEDKKALNKVQTFLQEILMRNSFNRKLVQAARDCFIGKRVALMLNFDEESGITLSFVPSLEFIFETDVNDVDRLTKFIQFYSTVTSNIRAEQRIYRKKFWLDKGFCWFVEEEYDGSGKLIETLTPETKTEFTEIPVAIIANDGLSGNPFGVSDIEELLETERWFSKLSNKDIDAIGKGADQIKYAIDIDPRTTKDLSHGSGAFWDARTSAQARAQGQQGRFGTIDNDMAYSPALDTTLGRLANEMYVALSVPDTTPAALRGVITSGKALKAIYWDLIVRCDEKMLTWQPALVKILMMVLQGASYYSKIAKQYGEIPNADDIVIDVQNNYPLPDDESEEKGNDLAEIHAEVMSRKAYMKKWRNMTEEEVTQELKQIKTEKALLNQDSYIRMDTSTLNEDEDE